MAILPKKNPIINDADTPDSLTIIYGTRPEQYVSDDIYYSYASILADLGGPTIDDDDWSLPEWGGTQHVGIHFKAFSEIISSINDLKLAKCFVISVLADNRSPKAGVTALKQLGVLYSFLKAKGYSIKMLSTVVLRQYGSWLNEQEDINDQQRNKIENVLVKLIPFCRRLGLLRPGEILFPRPRPVKTVKRQVPAPPNAVIHALDCYFFTHEDIPTDVKAAYLLGRFVPQRTAEVVHIPLDCLTVDDELAIIKIPTKKEAQGNIPETEEYPLLPYGQYERVLIQAVREQQQYARDNQANLKEQYRGYLMVSASNPKVLLTADKLNAFLRNVCSNLDLRDSCGEPVYITFYSLRHVVGVEMLGDTDIPREMTSSMFSHTRASTIDAYAYPASDDAVSRADEQIRTTKAMPITAGRLHKLQAQDGTWLVGTDAVCTTSICDPQYLRCWSGCPHFRPDPGHEDAAKALQMLLQERLAKGTIEQTQRQLEAITHYIEILEGDNGTSG